MAVSNQKRKKKRNIGFWPALVTMVAIVAAVVFCIALFFRVGKFEVTGNVRYTAEELIDASGIETGSNLLLVSKTEASGSIIAKLPYVMRVQVYRQLPNQVMIEVEECTATAVLEDAFGDCWLVSKEGRVLEAIDREAASQYPMLTGFVPEAPKAGTALQTAEPRIAEAVSAVLTALDDSSVKEKIVSIDIGKPYSIYMMYTDQYEVNLGGTDDLAYKITYLEQIVAELQQRDPEAGGQIDLTLQTEKVARFLPW